MDDTTSPFPTHPACDPPQNDQSPPVSPFPEGVVRDDRPANEQTSTRSEAPPSRPYWVPEGVNFDKLPRGLQIAIVAMINPAYKQLVLEAPSILERTAGLSYVHALWLEVLQQYELGVKMARTLDKGDNTEAQQEAIGRHLHLLSAKLKMGKFLIQLQNQREKEWRLLDPLKDRRRG